MDLTSSKYLMGDLLLLSALEAEHGNCILEFVVKTTKLVQESCYSIIGTKMRYLQSGKIL